MAETYPDSLQIGVEAPEPEYPLLEVDSVEHVRDETSYGLGTLTLTSRRVTWTPQADPQQAIGWDYPSIVIHAISTSPVPHIYCQMSAGDAEADPIQVKFIPTAPTALQVLYDAFSKGAELNPDPEMEEERDSDLFFNPDSHMSDGDDADDDADRDDTEDNGAMQD